MMFMARAIYTSWKFPLAYFLAHSGVYHQLLKNVIDNVIAELLQIGLCPKMLVCDQGTNNQSALKSLGINENIPYFQFMIVHTYLKIFEITYLDLVLKKAIILFHSVI